MSGPKPAPPGKTPPGTTPSGPMPPDGSPHKAMWWEGPGGIAVMGAWLFVSLIAGIAVGQFLHVGILWMAGISFMVMIVLAVIGYRVLGIGKFEP